MKSISRPSTNSNTAYIPLDILRQVEKFSAFQHTLLRLSLEFCNVTVSHLITLTNYFPNLNRLSFGFLLHEMDDQPAPPLSRLLIWVLYISEFNTGNLSILNQLLELGLISDKIAVDYWQQHFLPSLSSITDAQLGANVKCLRLLQSPSTHMYTHRSLL